MARKRETEVQVPADEQAPVVNGDLIIPRRRDASAYLVPAANARPDSYPTNLPTTPSGLALRVNCEGAADLEIGDDGVIELRLWAYLVHPVQTQPNEIGEVQWIPCVKMITADLQTFSTTGKAIIDRLASVIGHYGPGPWDGGIPVRIFSRKKKTGMGYYHDLRVVVADMEMPL